AWQGRPGAHHVPRHGPRRGAPADREAELNADWAPGEWLWPKKRMRLTGPAFLALCSFQLLKAGRQLILDVRQNIGRWPANNPMFGGGRGGNEMNEAVSDSTSSTSESDLHRWLGYGAWAVVAATLLSIVTSALTLGGWPQGGFGFPEIIS